MTLPGSGRWEVLMLLNPRLLWKIENCLSVKGGEPADFYLGSMRLFGLFLIVVDLGCTAYAIYRQFFA